MSIKMNDSFMGGDIVLEAMNDYKIISPLSFPDDAMLFLTFNQINTNVDDSFNLTMSSIWQYRLAPRLSITAEDVYKCVEMSRDHMQGVSNALFANQNAKINVMASSLENEIEEIERAIREVNG